MNKPNRDYDENEGHELLFPKLKKHILLFSRSFISNGLNTNASN